MANSQRSTANKLKVFPAMKSAPGEAVFGVRREVGLPDGRERTREIDAERRDQRDDRGVEPPPEQEADAGAHQAATVQGSRSALSVTDAQERSHQGTDDVAHRYPDGGLGAGGVVTGTQDQPGGRPYPPGGPVRTRLAAQNGHDVRDERRQRQHASHPPSQNGKRRHQSALRSVRMGRVVSIRGAGAPPSVQRASQRRVARLMRELAA